MPFVDLSNELLLTIADHIHCDADLSALAQVNSRFWWVLEGYLYRRNAKIRGSSALNWAVLNNREEVVRKALRGGADLVQEEKGTNGPFATAIFRGHTSIVKVLVHEGNFPINDEIKDPRSRWMTEDEQSYNSTTPLEISMKRRQLEITKFLISLPEIDLNGTKSSVSPLQLALEWKNEEITRLLVADDRVDFTIIMDKTTDPLSAAVSNGWTFVVELLLFERQLDPNVIHDNPFKGLTSLGIAVKHGRQEMAKFLSCTDLVDVNIRMDGGRSALHIAASQDNSDMAQLLIAHEDIDLNITDDSGRTPLSIAAGAHNLGVVQLLLSSGRVDINSRDAEGRTALSYAADQNLVDPSMNHTVEVLLKDAAIDVNSASLSGDSPLAYAVLAGNPNLVTLLLSDERVDPNTQNTDGNTPLMLAILYEKPVASKILADRRVKPNIQDNKGHTPLIAAVLMYRTLDRGVPWWSSWDAIKMLLADNRVKRRIKNKMRQTARDIAKERDLEEVLKLF